MNTSVTIGSSQEFRLSRALLLYGKSDYNGYPYRHPFITVHEVVHDSDGARLAEGQLVTPKMLSDLLAALGRSAPLEILPERVLVRTAEAIVWWIPACAQTMFFSDRGDDAALKKMNGRAYPQPPLVFKASGSHLWVRALIENRRPTPDSPMQMAPYWNCYDNGVVCTGTMTIPPEKSVAAIDGWEKSFFQSEFTHAGGVRKHTKYPGGLLAMWQALEGKKEFPPRYLVGLKQSLAEFVNDNDQSYRNAIQGN
ncbi:MAG: PRTRC system protein B [Terriglobales bacterium]